MNILMVSAGSCGACAVCGGRRATR